MQIYQFASKLKLLLVAGVEKKTLKKIVYSENFGAVIHCEIKYIVKTIIFK